MINVLDFSTCPVGEADDGVEIPDLRMGFGTSNVKSGTSTSNRHTHEFGPISKEWYRKRESEDLFYAMLLCACGATKEVVGGRPPRTQSASVFPAVCSRENWNQSH